MKGGVAGSYSELLLLDSREEGGSAKGATRGSALMPMSLGDPGGLYSDEEIKGDTSLLSSFRDLCEDEREGTDDRLVSWSCSGNADGALNKGDCIWLWLSTLLILRGDVGGESNVVTFV